MQLFLKGLTTGLTPGDPLLLVDGETRELFLVADVLPEREADHTRVLLQPWTQPEIGDVSGGAPSAAFIMALLERAPTGTNAAKIVEVVKRVLSDPQPETSGELLSHAQVKATLAEIDDILSHVNTAAPRLTEWALEVKTALRQAVRRPVSSPAAAAPPQPLDIEVSSIVSRLARRGSKPLSNALQLPRSLATDFRPTSDAGIKFIGAVAPTIRDKLGPALAGQIDSEATQTLEVHAFRVRAGVFGRVAPKRTELVGQPVNVNVIGDWPIVLAGPERDSDGGTIVVTRITESAQTVYLDAQYDGIVPGSWVMIDSSTAFGIPVGSEEKPLVTPVARPLLALVTSVHGKISRSEYGVTGDTVRVDFDAPWLDFEVGIGDEVDPEQTPASIDLDFRVVRRSTVFARSEKLELALEPITDEFCGASDEEEPAELDGLYSELEPGRFVVVSGERADLGEDTVVRASEVLMVRQVTHDVRVADEPLPWTDVAATRGEEFTPPKLPGDKPHTFVWFDKPLSYCYRRDTVSIRANVVKATHGETRSEVLGNGDGAKALQAFALKQFPLTYLAAPTASGAASTLEVFVNNVRWHEKSSFVDTGPGDRIFVTRSDELGKVETIFGNGIEGARLPTGTQNVKAVYRNGIGKGGNVRAEQISLLSTRPLGIKEVINSLRASGGADHETRDQARRNTPNAVMALDRLVSTRDYADFARAFAGIAKAVAVELPDGARTVVHVTIAGSDDIPIDVDSDLFINLKRALYRCGDPFQPLVLATRELLTLVMSARIRIHPDYIWEVVAKELRAKLLDAFGFERRDLGQGVAVSELLAVMQAVRGVEYVDLDSFGAVSATVPDAEAEGGSRPRTPEEIADAVQEIVATTPPASHVDAALARVDADGLGILPAQLAILLPDAPDTLVLNQIK
jgi:hypothetical protein